MAGYSYHAPLGHLAAHCNLPRGVHSRGGAGDGARVPIHPFTPAFQTFRARVRDGTFNDNYDNWDNNSIQPPFVPPWGEKSRKVVKVVLVVVIIQRQL